MILRPAGEEYVQWSAFLHDCMWVCAYLSLSKIDPSWYVISVVLSLWIWTGEYLLARFIEFSRHQQPCVRGLQVVLRLLCRLSWRRLTGTESQFKTLRLKYTKFWWDPLVEPFREGFPWSILVCVIVRFNNGSVEDPIRSVEDFISPLLETYRLNFLIIMMAGAFIIWW